LSFSLRRPRAIVCVEFVELVTDYLEDALPARERRAFEHHLERCDGCTAYLAQMRETRRLTGRLELDAVPETERLLEAFRAYQAGRD
jgi:anti-sigma factor RsiW